jgi:hypothetical protein
MRLPKPIATGVRFQSRALGSVYTAAQMKAYAAKAVEAEREACARMCEPQEEWDDPLTAWSIAAKIRARGSK